MARAHGAEVINFQKEDPIQALKEATNGSGPDRVIDAVGVDAATATKGPAADKKAQKEFKQELEKIAEEGTPKGKDFQPGGAPSQALKWAIECGRQSRHGLSDRSLPCSSAGFSH